MEVTNIEMIIFAMLPTVTMITGVLLGAWAERKRLRDRGLLK